MLISNKEYPAVFTKFLLNFKSNRFPIRSNQSVTIDSMKKRNEKNGKSIGVIGHLTRTLGVYKNFQVLNIKLKIYRTVGTSEKF